MTLTLTIKDQTQEIGPPLGHLPTLVAHEEGLFEAEGVEVRYETQPTHWRINPQGETDPSLVDSFNTHYSFEEGTSQVFGACEWGQVRRAYDSKRGGRIVGRSDGAQWHGIIVAPDSEFTHPRSLYNKPIAVRFHSGSHYATLELLEGFVRRDEIEVLNLGYEEGYEAVRRGDIAGVTLPEPWLTLAHKQGFHVVVETREYSAEIGSDDVDPEAWAAYNRARVRGAKLLNADKRGYFEKFFDRVLLPIPERYRSELAVGDFDLGRFHWNGPRPYTEEDFRRTYEWLLGWDLIGKNGQYDKVVNPSLVAFAGAV